MLTELQEKWLQALESGGYKQAIGDLCHDGNYCCLGVATEVFNPEHQALKDNGWDKWEVEGTVQTAPPDVVEALGLYSDTGRFDGFVGLDGANYDALVDLNDGAKWTFKQIAAFIRENPEKVFKNHV